MRGWLLSTKYSKEESYGQILVFLTEEGEIWEKYVRDVYPYFYTYLKPQELLTIPEVLKHYFDPRRRDWDRTKVANIEVVTIKNPINHRLEKITKIELTSPLFVTNKQGTGFSQLLPEQFVFNNHVKYADVFIMNKDDIILGMPYKLIGTKENFYYELDVDTEAIQKHEIYSIDALQRIEKKLFDYITKIFITPIPTLRKHILAIDIEVDHNLRMAVDSFNPLYPVSSVAFKSEREEIVFILSDKTRNIEKTVEDKFNVRKKVIVCKDEKTLLFNVFRYLTFSPEKIVVGYNIDVFDLPYLCNRADIYGIKHDNIWGVMKRDGTISKGIRGKFLIDLYSFFSNPSIKNYAFKGAYERNTLDDVAQALLGEEKYKYEGEIRNLSMYELAYYNLKDVDLTFRLCTFNDEIVMKLAIILQRIGNQTFESVFRKRISSIVLGLMHRYMIMKNFYFPNKFLLSKLGVGKSEAIIEGKGYKGAIVLEPKKGLHFNVTTLDFASLYPSVIDVKNICFSTINCEHLECRSNKVFEVGHHVCKLRRGILSEVVGAVKNVRVFYFKKEAKKNPLFKPIEQALKIVINASYGVFGAPTNPYYAQAVAESITAEARRSLLTLVEYVRENYGHRGIEVIYSDTDSIFINTDDEEVINDLIRFVREGMHLELGVDYEFKWLALYKKKNYVGQFKDGKIDIKGLAGKKRNTPKFIKDVFNEVIEVMKGLNENNINFIKDRITNVIKKYYYGLTKNTMDIDVLDLSIRNVLGKDIEDYTVNKPIHVKAAEKLYKYISEQFEDEVSIKTILPKGSVITYVKTDPKICGSTAMPVEIATMNQIDKDKYVQWMGNVLEQVLEPVGLDFNNIISTQRKITDFFK